MSELYSCKVLKYDIQVQIVHTNTDLKKGQIIEIGQIYVVPQVVPDLVAAIGAPKNPGGCIKENKKIK